jgi:hypothetical protein
MAVLVEGISVIIKSSAIIDRYPGGWETFENEVPNDTLCADNELVRIGFMAPADVQAFVERLENHGIVYLKNGKAEDLVVIDQVRGPAAPCDWIKFGHIKLGGNPNKTIAACLLEGSQSQIVRVPDGWEYEKSLSANFGFTPNESKDEQLVFVESRDGIDVYIDMNTGKQVYVGRAKE